MRLTWLGHSTVLVEVAGVRLMADPLLRARVGPLRRAVALPDAGPRLRHRVDAVSHLHHDHCDLPSVRMLDAPLVVSPPGPGPWLARRGIAGVTELAPLRVLSLSADVTVTAVPARHSGRREPFGPSALAVSHVVDGPEGAVWLAGDTGLYPDMRLLGSVTRRGVLDAAAVPFRVGARPWDQGISIRPRRPKPSSWRVSGRPSRCTGAPFIPWVCGR